jgi:hypothetical protein
VKAAAGSSTSAQTPAQSTAAELGGPKHKVKGGRVKAAAGSSTSADEGILNSLAGQLLLHLLPTAHQRLLLYEILPS